ncbi:aminotransferase [Cladochytrium replicatum]|nr:aminotransferase [Cladochytrium replicatum]
MTEKHADQAMPPSKRSRDHLQENGNGNGTLPNGHNGIAVDEKLDWENLGFKIRKVNCYVRYVYRDGVWSPPELVREPFVNLHVSAVALNYGQSCFEGLKAFRQKDGKVRIFRPDLNAERLIHSCKAAAMVAPSIELFCEAAKLVVRENIEFVPPYGTGGSMYLRPLVFGSGPQIGLHSADEYTFLIFVNPVGEFYKGGFGKALPARIKHGFDRAAPFGTGKYKLGGNYAPVLGPTEESGALGYPIMLFLDPLTHTYIDEFATSNFCALTPPDANGVRTYVTPKSASVLGSVTNRSLFELAGREFGWKAVRRPVKWDDVKEGVFEEWAACGTAVIITPVAEIHREVPKGGPMALDEGPSVDGEVGVWGSDEDEKVEVEMEVARLSENGKKFEGFRKLYDAYRALQFGELEGGERYGWMWPTEGL